MSERTFHFFHYKHATLHYSIYGTGIKPLFCFHGFGLTGESFFELEKKLSNEYSVYNFDLFFHGKSEWKAEDKPISESFLAELILKFNEEKDISSFSLLGYSIGARIVWAIANSFPDKIKEIIVLAPDGISTSIWYRLATASSVTRSVFKLFLSRKKYGSSFLKMGNFFKLLPFTTLRFAESQLQTKEQRDKVYKTWVVFRKLKANNSSLSKSINRNTIPLTIYLGKYDKIITYKTIQALVKKIDHSTIVVLEAGHSNLISKMVDYISYSSK